MKPPKPPSHLQDSSAAFWRTVQADYAIHDPAGLRLLTSACEALDAAESARAEILKAGQFYTDRFGAPRPHPAVAVQRNAHVTFARLVKTLGLDLAPPPPSNRRR